MDLKKFLLFAVLFVLLSFPHSSFELSFFGDGGEKETTIIKKNPRGLTERKFKFHRIERISVEDDVEDEEEEQDNKSANNNKDEDDDEDGDNEADEQDQHYKNDRSNKKSELKKKVVDLRDEDDDGADVVEAKRESRFARNAAISSSANEEEELQFERVHRAQQENTKADGAKNGGKSGKRIQSRDADKAEEETLFATLFNSLSSFFTFGADEKQSDKKTIKHVKNSDSPKKPANDNKDNDDAANTNGIINWLKWLGEKTGKTAAPAPSSSPSAPASAEGWMSYLNRWPFNSFFPFDASMKASDGSRRASKRRAADDGSCAAATAADPISQSHFESLLHTLPGFVVNASRVSDVECKRQMQVFHRQLRGNKLWALQMLDSTGRISSGLLRGNINQFGDFDLCTQVKAAVKVTPDVSMRIRGKYCLAHIEAQTASPELKVPLYMAQGRTLWNSHLGNPSHFAPRYAVASWGVCIPNLCTAGVVQEMIENDLRPYSVTGVEFRIEVNDNDCYTRQSNRLTYVKQLFRNEDKRMTRVSLLSIATLLLLMAASLLADYWAHFWSLLPNLCSVKAEDVDDSTEAPSTTEKVEEEQEQETPENEESRETAETSIEPSSFGYLLSELFRSFSPRRTLSELLSLEGRDSQFPIVHLLKLTATLMLYMCLKYLMIGHLPITNRDQLVSSVRHPVSILFRSPMIYSDVLLFVSGFLSASQLTEEIEQRTYIQVLKRLTSKIMRYLPTICFVLVFQTWLLPHLGTGPLWYKLIGQQSSLCETQMWRNVFSVQNAINVEETCSPMTLQLALEMQLFILAPLIVWLYYTDSDAGFFIYGALHAVSVAARFSRTTHEHLSVTWFHGMNISKFYRTANVLYSSPISRATPYLLGIGAGILQQTQAGELGISSELVPLGWLLSMLSIIWCFWAPSSGTRIDHIYSASDAAVYSSWSPLLLGLSLAWAVLMCPRVDDSLLHKIASSRLIVFLSRVSFPTQLAAYLVVLYNTATVREANKYYFSNFIDVFEIFTIIVIGIALSFLIDVPAKNIRRLLVECIFAERRAVQDDDVPPSVTEPSEADLSEERSENVTCDTPEPPDSIWAMDPEEEEEPISVLIEPNFSFDENTTKSIEKRSSEDGENIVDPAQDEEVVIDEEVIEDDVEEVEDEVEEREEVVENTVNDKKKLLEEETKIAKEDVEDDEEVDMAEDEEIKRRPDSHSPTPPTDTSAPPLKDSPEKDPPVKPTFRRRPIREEN